MTQQPFGGAPDYYNQPVGQPQGGFPAPGQGYGQPPQGPPAFAGQPQAQPAQGWGQQPQQQAPMGMPQQAADPTAASGSFFGGMTGGGSGVPSFKWGHVGDSVQGVVVSATPFDVTEIGSNNPVLDAKNGQPAKQLQIVLQTGLRNWDRVAKIPTDDEGQQLPPSEDNGERAIYTGGKRSDGQSWMSGAIRDAMVKAGRDAAQGLEKGAALAIRVSEEVPTDKGNPYRKYEAQYASPGSFSPAAITSPAVAPQQAPAPQQQAPQQQAPQQQAPQQQAAPPQGDNAWGGYQAPDQGQGLPPQPPQNPFGAQQGQPPF